MGKSKHSIAAVLTCYNRKEKTVTCLKKLMNQDGISDVDLDVFLVDDGSTDGTGDAVKKKFPQVNVLQGDGTLFWNGGMRFAFSVAKKRDYDHYLWLNDDTYLYSNALKKLFETLNSIKQENGRDIIVTGTIIDIDTRKVNYGGQNKKSILQPLEFIRLENKNEPQHCDTFNGNVVLIPRIIAQTIGNISPEYSKQHAGDFDYGLRANYAGFESWVAPGVIGTCSSNSIVGTLFDTSLSLKERIKKMDTPQGAPPVKERMIFSRRHAGFLWPIYWIRTIVRVIFPWTYLLLRKPK
ncbi:MAG: glycosyltransferase family 2 protein [Candidatus Neomarinimicrobiota bacterium]